MKSWGPDYGYELINAEWQLKYPPCDPNVVRAVAQAVELARQEHARLVAAAPSKYGKRPRAGAYRSSLAGQDGAGDEQGRGGGGDSPGFYSSKPSDRYGQRYAGGSLGNGSGGSAGTGSGNSSSHGGKGGFGIGDGSGGSGIGSDDSGHDGGNNASADEYAANNPYQSLPLSGGAGPARGVVAGGTGIGSSAGPSGTPGSGGLPFRDGGGSPGSNGSPYGGGTGSGGAAGGESMTGGGMASGAAGAGGMAGGGQAGGSSGSPGAAGGGMPSLYSPMFGQQDSQGGGSQAGGGQPGTQGSTQPGSQSNGQAAYQGGGQSSYQATGQSAGTAAAAGVARPDGYITGQPYDANSNPPPQRPNPSSNVAMVPDTPLRPGEWRPSQDPPKPDPEEEKKKKKKHPYDDVEPDRNQADWALRNARSHAAAISRPLHVDLYADRVVIAPDQPGGEPQIIVCGRDGQRNADKLVAAIWERIDTWGMAGKEMYWRPVLNFYVVPGAEPRLFELSRNLDGSGLVIERKQ